MSSFGKDSAQLEREVEEQRQRIESRIGEIRERLSPGQLVDELLSYTKHGGQHFAANLGSTVSANPLPVALIGVGIAWLISGQGPKITAEAHPHQPHYPGHDYPYATTSGSLRRVTHAQEDGVWYSEFSDTAGKRYRARSNELGERAGHFMDDAGRKFGGFLDETGHRVKDFQDEAGNRLDDAAGWASHAWHDAQHGVSQALGQVAQQAGSVARQAGHIGNELQAQGDQMTKMVLDTFKSQPLVGGALAFALGAALGAALPPTRQEDDAVGELADSVKGKAVSLASDVYDEGKARAAELYEKGKEGVAKVYEDVTNGSGATSDPARPIGLH